MLARDWYYNQRRQLGLDSAVASIYDRHDDSDVRARAALTMLGVQRGWRVADIGCGNGVLACEAALLGAEVDAIDISPAMLALAKIYARDRKVAVRTQSAGMLSFAYQPNSYDLIVSEFTLHHLPDFWKAVALARIFAALKPGANFTLDDIRDWLAKHEIGKTKWPERLEIVSEMPLTPTRKIKKGDLVRQIKG